jgi:hypothetical protein
MTKVAAHPEDANEEAAAETVGPLAIGRHRQPRKRNQGNGGSRQNLAAA